MKTLNALLAIITLLSSTFLYAQSALVSYNTESYNALEKTSRINTLPSFENGYTALQYYLNTHLAYPEYEKKMDIEGTVLVQFYIMADGTLQEIEVIESLSPGLDREAIRLVENMPRWNPAIQNGQAMRVKYRLPVTFELTF